MTTISQWIAGARPRTLPAAIVPVVVASAGAQSQGGFIWDRALLALVVSLAIQVGTNYANDYSDGKRGTDDVRVGPMRLVASQAASAKAVLYAALGAFLVSAIAGASLAILSSPYLFLVGLASLLAGWFYTGGKRPYGYLGLGEVFVFVFFGLVAVVGSYFVQVGRVDTFSILLAIPVGFLAVALLVINNLRDIETDMQSSKMTLAVRLGDRRTRGLYVALVILAPALSVALVGWRHFAALGLAALIFAIRPIRMVRSGTQGRSLIAVLVLTGRLQIIFGVLLSIGILL